MIDGINELNVKLNNISDLSNTVKSAVNRGCKIVQAEAKLLCPVDKGELRNSIKTKVDEDGKKIVGTVYTNKKYAAYVEYGTGPTGAANHSGISPHVTPTYSSKGWVHYDKDTGKYIYSNGQAAQPYMYPALHNNIDKARDYISDEIKKHIRKAIH